LIAFCLRNVFSGCLVGFVFVSELSECVNTPLLSNQTLLAVAGFFIQHWRKNWQQKE